MLRGDFVSGDTVLVDATDEAGVVFNKKEPPAAMPVPQPAKAEAEV